MTHTTGYQTKFSSVPHKITPSPNHSTIPQRFTIPIYSPKINRNTETQSKHAPHSPTARALLLIYVKSQNPPTPGTTNLHSRSSYDSFRSLSSFELVDKFSVSCDDAANFASAACRAAAAAAKRPALERNSRLRSGMPITSKSSPDRGRLPRVVRRLAPPPPADAFLSLSSGLLLLLLASMFCLSISWS